MFQKSLKVKYVALKTCFCYLSDTLSKLISQGISAKITYGNENDIFLSLGSFLTYLKENELGINAYYARILNLEEGDVVNFSECHKLPGISSLDIRSETKDDYEILELMSEQIQTTLLDQIHVVNNETKVLIWLSNNLRVTANVEGIVPVAPGKLNYLTQVVIKEPHMKRDVKINTKTSWNINSFMRYFNNNISDAQLRHFDKCIPLIFCIYPVTTVQESICNFNSDRIFDAYVLRDFIPNPYHLLKYKYFTLNIIEPPSSSEYVLSKTDGDFLKNIVIKLDIINSCNLLIPEGRNFIPLFLNEKLFKEYEFRNGSKALLERRKTPHYVTSIEIRMSKPNDSIRKKFKLYISNTCKFDDVLLNADFPLNIGSDIITLHFEPKDVKTCLINADTIRKCKLNVVLLEVAPKSKSAQIKKENIFVECSNINNILDDSLKSVTLGLVSRKLENLLIIGKSGTGKSTLSNEILRILSEPPYYVYTHVINGKSMKGKSIESLHKLLCSVFLELVFFQPSVLLFDDLHVLCENVNANDVLTPESILFNKISELISDLFQTYLHDNEICILATSESTHKINKQLLSFRGSHTFKNIFTLRELNKNDRKLLLKFLFSKYGKCAELDFNSLSAQTDGYVIQDLIDFTEKCFFEACKHGSEVMLFSHCENVLKHFSTLALNDVQLYRDGGRDFSDIGGLDDVKTTLVESMLWPVQYTNLFEKSPIRMQSGLLLYGLPGTGKTILASAAARQCGLRLISVKGPELLSKYIGASEQAVRDVFQKAQSAKPCILFFDEFDSLAPRRGHDNTGVTDRVVNQFLTQLDGVEALNGVCVLAATSRPDLLDPALLRPGRLDRQILCPMPNMRSRLDILHILSRSITLFSDVDLNDIAKKTEDYSGADLKGLLQSAQLICLKRLLGDNMEMADEVMVQVTQSDLLEAVKTTRPSLPKKEKVKYDIIYSRFQNVDSVIDFKNQRATLA